MTQILTPEQLVCQTVHLLHVGLHVADCPEDFLKGMLLSLVLAAQENERERLACHFEARACAEPVELMTPGKVGQVIRSVKP